MKPILVFDLDGTLVDSLPDLAITLNIILERENFPSRSAEEIRPFIGLGAKAMLKNSFAVQGRDLSEKELDQFFGDFLNYYEHNCTDHSRPFPNVLEVLEQFRLDGWTLAVCTNKLEYLAKKVLQGLKIDHYFSAIIGADTFGVKKPDPDHLLKTIKQAGGNRNQAIMVGDAAPDVEAAKAANIPSIGVTFGYSPVSMQELNPDYSLDDFQQLPHLVNQIMIEV